MKKHAFCAIFQKKSVTLQRMRKNKIMSPIKQIQHFCFIYIILSLLFVLRVHAEEANKLSQFQKVSVEEGLSDKKVATLTEAENGDIVIRHDESIDVMHNENIISSTQMPKNFDLKIPNVHWARVTRYDKDNNYWLKQPEQVWCYNLNTRKFIDISKKDWDDVFVDESHNLWILKDSILSANIDGKQLTVNVRGKQKILQSVDLEGNKLYAFYNDGELICYSIINGEILYRKRPYTEEESIDYERSFTIRKGTNGFYYVLHHNYHKCIFLVFNPNTKEWRTIFQTTNEQGFHCLEMPTEEIAIIGCPTGIWIIDVATGQMELSPTIPLSDGTNLNTGVNAVLQTHNGKFLIGTYDQGLLIADKLFASESNHMIIITLVLAVLLFCGIIFALYYQHTQKKKRAQLMLKIQELMQINNLQSTQTAESEQQETQQINELSERDMEILKLATSLVKKNISHQGYNVDDLARDMGMERTGLYRHLNRIIQQSPSAFIRSIRMERAMELVKEKHLTITEISEQLGFSTVSYFSKCFKDYYGYNPSEFKS